LFINVTSGCSQEEITLQPALFELVEISIPADAEELMLCRFTSVHHFMRDSFIFYAVDLDYNISTFFRYCLETGTYEKIGESESRWLMRAGQMFLTDNATFFYQTVFDDSNELLNAIYTVDLLSNRLFRVAECRESGFGINSYRYHNNALFTIKVRVEGDNQITYLEKFCFNDNTRTILSESIFCLQTTTGTVKVLHDIDDDTIYMLYAYKLDADGEWAQNARIYDINMNFLRNSYIDEIESLLASRPGYLRIFGRYMYLFTFAPNAVIGRIEDDGNVTPLVWGHWMHSQNPDKTAPVELFFHRDSANPRFLVLDTNSGEFAIIDIDLDARDSIGDVVINGNQGLIQTIRMCPDEGRSNGYFLFTFF